MACETSGISKIFIRIRRWWFGCKVLLKRFWKIELNSLGLLMHNMVQLAADIDTAPRHRSVYLRSWSRTTRSFTRLNVMLCRLQSAEELVIATREDIQQGSSTFWVRGPIYIFHIILRAAVIADYKIIMDILIIIIGAWAARQLT